MEESRKSSAPIAGEGTDESFVRSCLRSFLTPAAAAAGAVAQLAAVALRCCPRRHSYTGIVQCESDPKSLEEGAISLQPMRRCRTKDVQLKAYSNTLRVDGLRLEGDGAAFADTVIEQDKCYFEVRIVEAGTVRIGVSALPRGDVSGFESATAEQKCWMSTFGTSYGPAVEDGDIISCSLDQSDCPASVQYLLNGTPVPNSTLTGVRGEVWPAVFIADGASVECIFNVQSLTYFGVVEGRGFQPLLASRNLI